MRHDDLSTGWSFDCLTDPGGKPIDGGLTLQNVRHDGHNFAKDIRVIGLWIEVEDVDATGRATNSRKKLRTLSTSNYFQVSEIRTLKPQPISHTIYKSPTHRVGDAVPITKTFDYLIEVDKTLDFKQYFRDDKRNYVAYGVAATFDSPSLLLDIGFENCDQMGLSIEQVFLFSRYSDQPRHEPSGNLTAARFHPLLFYAFKNNPNFDPKQASTRLKSVRFDYRLHLYVDRRVDVAVNAKFVQLGNQAGVFADNDSGGHALWKLIQGGKTRSAFSSAAFYAAEKPLIRELYSPGLIKGFPNTDFLAMTDPAYVANLRGWDNVHWWGARGVFELPSTPGAFHCLHLHWRWGAAIKVVTQKPPFNPNSWPDELGSRKPVKDFAPIVDPGIFMQSLWFAVTLNDPLLDPAKQRLVDLTDMTWKSLFDPGLRPAPRRIDRLRDNDPPGRIDVGEDIVFWYSTEVPRRVAVAPEFFDFATELTSVDYTSALAGVVFLHGIFFAHEAEPEHIYGWFTNWSAGQGDTGPMYRPRSADEIVKSHPWMRPASEI